MQAMNKLWNKGLFRSQIARRLIIAFVVFSSLITVVTTTIQLFGDYRHGLLSIESDFELIEASYLESLADSLWTFNSKQVELQLAGVINLPNIEYVEILVDGEVKWSAGGQADDNVVSHEVPIRFQTLQSDQSSVVLKATASLSSLYQRLWDRALTILVSNAVKTFLVVGFVFLIFDRLVTQRVGKLAHWVGQLSINSPEQSSGMLPVPEKTHKPDELDELSETILGMHEEQLRFHLSLQKHRDHLEDVVEERTRNLVKATVDLQRTTNQKNLILQAAGEGIYGVDLEGRCTFINQVGGRLLGYEPHELIGQLEHAVIHHSRTDGSPYLRGDCPVDATFKDGKEHRITNEVFWRKDGSQFAVEYTSAPMIEKGSILGAVIIFKDITTQKESEQMLIDARDQAERANEAKSRFLASMSHELRTPLNAIIGFTDMMKRDARLHDELQDHLDIVNQSGDHLLALINDILDIAKAESGKITLDESNIELAGFLQAIVAMLAIRAHEKDLPLVLQQETTLPDFICTDELKLRQVLINLIGNAIKFTERGQITVTVGYRAAAQDPDAGGCLQFAIQDTGPGMTAREQETLFEAFTQTEAGYLSSVGTGLGLTISQRFVELFGGDIEVESTPGQGSVFRFSVDVTIAREGKMAQQMRDIEGLAPGQPFYKLLVVEDVEFSRILLVNLLERIGFEVQSAVNGEQAVSMAASFRPDLIWMDILMPVMDGKEATKHIRQLPGGDTLPIIAVTASATLMDKASLLACGFDEVMFKPYHQTQVVECLEAQLGVVFVDKQAVAIETPARVLAKLDKGQLRAIPDESRAALRKAVTEGDIERIQHLIAALADDLAELKVALMSLVEGFEFETLLQGLNDES